MILILILYSIFGFTFTIAKISLRYASPFFIVASRMTLAGLGIMAYIYFSKKIRCIPTKTDRWLHAQIAFFGIFLPYCARAWALQYVTTSKAALLFNLAPFFVALYSYVLFKEKLSLHKLIGLLLGFFGMLPLLLSGTKLEDMAGSWGAFSFPEIALLISVASFSYSMLVMQKLLKHHNCPSLLANGFSMLTGGSLALFASYFVESRWVHGSWYVYAGLLTVQILLSNIICSQLQAYLLKQYSATLMSLANFLTPLSAAFFGWLIFGEKITWHYFVSCALVSLGLYIYYYGAFFNRRRKQPPPVILE